MNLEKIWYETSPYLFGATGTSAVLYERGSFLLKGSGLLLFAAALTAVLLRWISRSSRDAFDDTPRE